MAAATILHVGDDLCHRIRVMEHAGLRIVRTGESVSGLEEAFAVHKSFSGIAFTNQIHPLPSQIVSTARTLSQAPLVLFEHPFVSFDERLFDLVIPAHTPPNAWLQSLRDTIEASRKICEGSRRLRQDCADIRAYSRRLRDSAARNRGLFIDADAPWRGEPGQ